VQRRSRLFRRPGVPGLRRLGRALNASIAPLRPVLPAYAALAGCYFAAIGLFNPYAPLWFQSLGLSTLAIGAIASLQAWTRVISPYGWGWLGDHRGSRVGLIRLAAFGALAAALGLLGVQGAVPVALVTMLLFLANGGIPPLYEATLAQLLSTPDGVDPHRYGRVRLWGSVGFIVSVSSFGVLLERFGIAVFPIFVAVMNALLLLAALRLPRAHDETVHDEPAPPVLPLLRRPPVAWFFASMFFTVLAHTSLYTFFSLYLVSLGYGKSWVGALWAVSVVAEIAFFAAGGAWFARFAPERWLAAVGAVTAARFALMALAGAGDGGAWTLPLLALAQLTHAVTFAAHHIACILLVQRHFPGRLRGRGQALYTVLGYGFSGVIGGLAGGWLVERAGFLALFSAAALAGLAAWGCALQAGRGTATD
jgi:MFS transporter, PPP family, 3-phenylpropionic acid transporter